MEKHKNKFTLIALTLFTLTVLMIAIPALIPSTGQLFNEALFPVVWVSLIIAYTVCALISIIKKESFRVFSWLMLLSDIYLIITAVIAFDFIRAIS